MKGGLPKGRGGQKPRKSGDENSGEDDEEEEEVPEVKSGEKKKSGPRGKYVGGYEWKRTPAPKEKNPRAIPANVPITQRDKEHQKKAAQEAKARRSHLDKLAVSFKFI